MVVLYLVLFDATWYLVCDAGEEDGVVFMVFCYELVELQMSSSSDGRGQTKRTKLTTAQRMLILRTCRVLH